MANNKKWLGISALMLVFGITLLGFNGCSKNVDLRLNGTWKGEYGIEKNHSGYYEVSDEDGNPLIQGIYTTSDGKMTSSTTHFFGADFDLEKRWYSREEFKDIFGDEFESEFESYPSEYTVDGNTLTYIYDDGDTYVLTLVNRNGRFKRADTSVPKPEPELKSNEKKK